MINTTQTRTDEILQGEADFIVQTYKRPPFLLVHGEGVNLFDSDGKRYTDWVAGIAVNALGYGDAGISRAINAQLATGITHTSNLYHTAPHVDLARALVENSFADRVFFCNSGTEANEGAIKFARKVAYLKEQSGKHEIVTFTGGFHGRTMGALTLTPKAQYQTPFRPLLSGVLLAEFNNIKSARTAITDDTCAVIVEPIQGEGGINPATPEFLRALRDLCDQHDAVLIFDEIQCGVGRTGDLWAHQATGVTPDIMTVAKPLASGLPVGAVLVTQAVADAMKPGDHGSTFAGGALVMSAALETLTRINQPEFLAHVREVGAYLRERLEALTSEHIVAIRGRGLMVALELNIDVTPVIAAGYDHGLLLVNAGANVLRFVPPLIVTRAHVDELVAKLGAILREVG